MTYKTGLIGTVLAASVAITASIALAQTGGQATQGTGQEASEPKWTGHMIRMAEHCNAMMKGSWQ
jgi:hypothetical protein